jgi:hypothetical protein
MSTVLVPMVAMALTDGQKTLVRDEMRELHGSTGRRMLDPTIGQTIKTNLNYLLQVSACSSGVCTEMSKSARSAIDGCAIQL